ncbi:unnamed protein product [Leptidea sinapis]|uniref:MADF domain-containing protein n=1 Tax=Leptidea sinapis TaxID=189913 RepID=A0A5E4QHJ8_9NEOP|nr:unnamed protein product [Leptidea sinapis]
MNFNWSSKEDEQLIEFVRAHEVLYNVKNENHRKKQLKQKLWCEVGEILSKSYSDCHKRWCYVRDYYIRRRGKPGTGGEAARKRSELLSFLDHFPSSQRNSNINVIEVADPGKNTGNNSEHTQENIINRDDNTSFNNESDSNSDTCEKNEEIIKEFKRDFNSVWSNQKRRKYSQNQERFNVLKHLIANRKPSTQNDVLNETDLFFSSMAKIVKKLPRYEQAQLRMQIGELVGNAELRYSHRFNFNCASPRPSTSSSD